MKHMDEAARAQAAGEGEATKAPAGLDLERLQRELDEDPTLQAILEEVRRGAAAQLLEGQLAAIGRLDPRVQCAEDLVKLPCFAAFDELVRGEDAPKSETAAPAAQAVPASFTPQTSSEQEKRHTIAGTILMCIGAVLLLTCLILAGDLLAGLIYGLPFFLCGIICFTVKHRTGLWCGWAAYLCIDLYLRFATGLSWTTVFMTHLWTAQMNYARLAISWVQLLGMLVMIVCTARSYRMLRLPATKKEGTWLIAGWLAALVVLPLLMSYGVMPLLLDDLGNYSNISPYFLLNVVYSYARLALINILLVRTLAVWRLKREEKKAEK